MQEKSRFMGSWVHGFLIETELRVFGSGMKSQCASAPFPPELPPPAPSGAASL
jgi:hypothetical protein